MPRQSTIDDIAAELVRLREQKEELDVKVASLEGTLVHFASLPIEEVHKTDGRKVKDTLHKRLTEEGQPMHRTILYEFLKSEGIFVGGDNPVNNMTSHMSHDIRFESEGEGNWGLAEWRRSKQEGDWLNQMAKEYAGREDPGPPPPPDVDAEDLPW